MSAGEKDLLDKIDGGLAKAEGALLVVVMVVMVGLSVTQLVLRKFFDFGFEWADITVRQMVLWLGFMGGALATYQKRHIAIDALSKLLSPKKAALMHAFTSLVAVVLSGILVKVSWNYLLEEYEDFWAVLFKGAEGELGSIDSWPFEVIMPFALLAIMFHFLVGIRNQILVSLGKREPMNDEEEMGV